MTNYLRTVITALIGVALVGSALLIHLLVEVTRSEPTVSPSGTQSSPAHVSANIDANRDDRWELYTDNTAHYQITYPARAVLNAASSSEVRFDFRQLVGAGANQALDEFSFRVRVFDNPQNLTPEEWVINRGSDEGMVRQQGRKVVNIGGKSAYQVSVFGFDQWITQIYVGAGSRIYCLSYWDPETMTGFSDADREMYKAIFNQMVGSFRFL